MTDHVMHFKACRPILEFVTLNLASRRSCVLAITFVSSPQTSAPSTLPPPSARREQLEELATVKRAPLYTMVAPRMSIKFLGTSSMPNPTRNYSSLLFKLDKHTVMVDCGEGTQRQFRPRYVGADERLANLKTILITHLHADHVLGLVPLLMSMMGPSGASPPADSAAPRVEIYGPPGLRALIRTTLSLCYSQLSGKYVVHEFVWPSTSQLPDGAAHALSDQLQRMVPDLPLHDGEVATGRDLGMDSRSYS